MEEKASVRQAMVTQREQCRGMTFGFAVGNIEAPSAGCQHYSASILHAAIMLESQALQTMRHTRGLK